MEINDVRKSVILELPSCREGGTGVEEAMKIRCNTQNKAKEGNGDTEGGGQGCPG